MSATNPVLARALLGALFPSAARASCAVSQRLAIGSFIARETVRPARDEQSYAGTIVFEFFDTSGTLVDRRTGEVRAERMVVE